MVESGYKLTPEPGHVSLHTRLPPHNSETLSLGLVLSAVPSTALCYLLSAGP